MMNYLKTIKIFKKFKKVGLALTLLFSLNFSIAQPITTVLANDISGYVARDEDSTCEVENTADVSSDSVSVNGLANGDWTTEGTTQYQVAKLLFKILTEEYGLSGKSAAGWLGNVQAESSFNFSITEAENGQNYSGRGYGLFQFTPGSKYLNTSYYNKDATLEEHVRSQVQFVWDSEFKNGAYKAYLSNASSWFGITANSIDDILANDDSENAMLIFFAVYERGDVSQMHRDRRAQAAATADSLFNKDNIKADKSKWNVDGAELSSSSTFVSTTSGNESNDECATDESSETAADGTGDVPADATEWGYTPSSAPASLSTYIHNPEDVGLSYGGSNGWVESTGQCVALTESLGNLIWGHSGVVIGDGWAQASAWAKIFGNEVKSTPKAGAIFSTNQANNHTGIVSHVFKDGSVLIIEQNTPLSGANAGKTNTWNYRIVSPSTQTSEGWTFAYPDDKEPSW